MSKQKSLPRADRQRERMARRSRDAHAKVAELGKLPPVKNRKRRNRARNDLLYFLQTYFPGTTGLSPFSEDHKRVIARIQRCLLKGGRFVNCVYRGFAKTTIAQNAALWAVLFGHRRYVVIIAAEAGAAEQNLHAIKSELETNDLLLADFPEVCVAVRALEGKAQRCTSQTHCGKRTHIGWKGDRIILPTIAGSIAGGALIACCGITGSGIRGLNHRTPSGKAQRPDAAIVDDIQTDRSAVSPHQVNALIGTIKRTVLKLNGHSSSMACVVNATVLAADDVVEQLLDPKKNPRWQGERIKMVRKWSDAHETLWLGTASGYEGESYARIRNTFNREDEADQERAHQRATEFYKQNLAAMNAGCDVSWAGCFDPEVELSAIQHAYNMLIDDGDDVFATECQVQPPKATQQETSRVSASQIVTRLNGYDRYGFPRDCEYLTAYIDVQDTLLYYCVCGWSVDFTGFIIDYGAFPDQRRRYFSLNDASKTLQQAFPSVGTREGRWHNGLTALLTELVGREWKRTDGAVLPIGRVLIDASYGHSTKTVKRFCHTCAWRSIVMASHGKGIAADAEPMANWTKKDGERHGFNWIIRPDKEAQGMRHALIDTNSWKSFVHSRLSGLAGERSSLTLWGNDGQVHEMIANHLTAEAPVRTHGRNRTVDVWKLPANKPDNHLFDCVVGCAVGASMLGCHLPEHAPAGNVKRKRKPLVIKGW